MKNELTILNQLQKVLTEKLNNYIPDEYERLDEKCFNVDFPDTDSMPRPTMLYIVPNWAEYQNLTTESDDSNFNLSIFIICKRDKKENLIKKALTMFNAVYLLLRSNMTLDGYVDFVESTGLEYYPAVEGEHSVVGAEMSVSVRYTKDF